jgi:hypothetical protein
MEMKTKTMNEPLTKSKRRRANTMKLVRQVVTVGETLKSRAIMDRMLSHYGVSHSHLPRNVTTLASVLKGDPTMTQVTDHHRRFSWRRDA